MSNKKIFITFILYFLFCITVNAECSYQERKDLANKANDIQIKYDIVEEKKEESYIPDAGEETETSTKYNYKIKINVINNYKNDLYIEYYNDNDDEEKIFGFNNNYSEDVDKTDYGKEDEVNSNNQENENDYIIDENISDIYSYYFIIRSLNNNCLGEKISSKEFVKPKYNTFVDSQGCLGNEDIEYCSKFITKEISISDFNKKINSLNKGNETQPNEDNNNEKEENKESEKKQNSKNILVLSSVFLFIILIIFSVILIRKKKSKLI